MSVTVSQSTGLVSVPTTTEFAALAAKVSMLQTTLITLTTRHDALVAEVIADEGLIAALQVPAVPPVVVQPPAPSDGGIIFASDWASGEPILLSVVPGFGPGGRNALKVLQRGQNLAAAVQKDGLANLSTDYYVRFWMRNDDTSGSGDHCVTPDIYRYPNLTYIRKMSNAAGWTFVMSLYGVAFIYPVSHIGPAMQLAHGTWYRFEYFVHFVDATHVQVHPRVYDASGMLILSDADFQQSDWGSAVLNGASNWTLERLYATGFSYAVVPDALQSFAMGNNGQAGAVDTGLPWYFAGLEIRTDRWPGP